MAAASMALTRKALTELVGTLFLCLTIALTGKSSLAALPIGCALMLLVYAGGHVSGAHYNPAVTLAILVRGGGKLGRPEALVYVLSQLAGALGAVLIAWALVGKASAAHPQVGAGVDFLGSAVLAEFMVTFALCSVVLHTATSKAQANNSYYGLAIGFTVLSGAVSVGGISGGAFNPAVGAMSLLYGTEAASQVWIYLVGPLAAGAVAGAAFRFCAVEEYSPEPTALQREVAPLAVEFIGTMMLCYTVGTAAGGTSVLAPLSIGSMLMVMVYMGGAISGAHYNPAVTLAVLLRNFSGATSDSFTWQRACKYVGSQVLGSLCGGLAAWATLEERTSVGYPRVPPGKELGQAMLGEVLGTFLLAYVVLNVATVKQLAGNSFFGLAIGMTVTAMAHAIGPISGGAFNPAVGLLGPFLGGEHGLSGVWIYWLACPMGSAAAALFFRLQNAEEFQAEHTVATRYMAHVSDQAVPRYMTHAVCGAGAVAPESSA